MSLDTVSNFELQLRHKLATQIIDEFVGDPRVAKVKDQLEILEAEMRKRCLLENKNVEPAEDANKDEDNQVVRLKTLSLWSEAGDT